MKKGVEFVRLFRQVGWNRRIFFRREHDQLGRKIQTIAGLYRRFFLRRTRIVAIVGSLGKTTTRHALAVALNCPNRNFSYSNYGASLAGNLLRVRPHDRHAVLEAGIAGPGWMAGYGKMIRPDLVVVTSIKSEHNRTFATLLETRAEKVKMVQALAAEGIAVLNGDDPNVRWMATQTKARVISFGLESGNDIRAVNIFFNNNGTANFKIQIAGLTFKFHSPLIGTHMIYPLLAAIAVAHAEGKNLAEVIPRLEKITPPTSRMELFTLPGGIHILDDSLKSTQESIETALETFSKMKAARKIVVLGRIEEPVGKERDRYRELGVRLAPVADLIFCIGDDELKSLRAAALKAGRNPAAIQFLGSRIAGVAEQLQAVLQPGDLVLFKGASHQRLRRIVLQIVGKNVACSVKYCAVKVVACDACPLLAAPETAFKNYFISRYIKF